MSIFLCLPNPYLAHLGATASPPPTCTVAGGRTAGRSPVHRKVEHRQADMHSRSHSYLQAIQSLLSARLSRCSLNVGGSHRRRRKKKRKKEKEPTQTCENSAQEEPRDQTWASVRGGDSVKPESTPDQRRLFHEYTGRGGVAVFLDMTQELHTDQC